jgi:[protein-PII] uridylyltransferase
MNIANKVSTFPPPLDLNTSQNILPAVKYYLREGEEALKRCHLEGASGSEVVASYTLFIDNLIKTIFARIVEDISDIREVSLIALGGYGRRELNIRSDIDMMLLYPRRLSHDTKNLTEKILYLLWDTGLDVGFSVRSLKECIRLAREDLKTRTAILDSRPLAGDDGIFKKLEGKVRKKIFDNRGTRRFVREKLEESSERHKRYGGSVYILEPNVRDGEGGLRDYHTAIWMLKALKGVCNFEEVLGLGYLSTDEFSQLIKSVDFLWRVRNDLHFETRRKADQLTFDHQERIAKTFGYRGGKTSLAVEEFMMDYYRHAFNLNHISSLVTSRLLHEIEKGETRKRRVKKIIDGDFKFSDGLLSVIDTDIFDKRPETMMKAFEYANLYNAKLDSHTNDLILKNLSRVDNSFINSRIVSESFLNILKSKDAYKTLQEMHRLKFLGRYIPEFEDVTHRMQHDLYHIYTVDIHSLFAVRELERLEKEYTNDYPVKSSIYKGLDRHDILKLAVLLHDIGKSKGRGHAIKGRSLAADICRRLGLSEEDTNLVVFLVQNHLILADTAQYRDLHDEKLIVDFTRTVGDLKRLNLLYLLTFADIRAVGPEVWTRWKWALFQELYFKAIRVLERGNFEIEDTLKKVPGIKEKVVSLLEDEVPRAFVENYFNLLPYKYFLSNAPNLIAEHITIVKELQTKPFAIRIRQIPEREYTEMTLCTTDIHGLFSKVAGVMTANNINILGAQIYTLKNGIVLDVIQTNSSLGKMITDETKWKSVEKDINDTLVGKIPVEMLVAKRRPSILDRKVKPRVRTTIAIDNEVSDTFTVIDIHAQDRIGLLYTITSAISKLGFYITIAKISTKGEDAADIFYVKDIFGQKVYHKEKLKNLRDTLYRVLGEEPPEDE